MGQQNAVSGCCAFLDEGLDPGRIILYNNNRLICNWRLIMDTKKSCWDCKYYKIPAIEILGECHWFPEHGKGDPKPLNQAKDPYFVDKGCKFFCRKEGYADS